VNSGSTPVTAGSVIFILNGRETGRVQVVGSRAGSGHTTGTATLAFRLPHAVYTLSARYVGTSTWDASSSDTIRVVVPGFSNASLALRQAQANTYAFSLTTSDSGKDLEGEVRLKDLSETTNLAKSDLRKAVAELNLQTKNLNIPFTPSALVVADLSGRGTRDLVIGDGTSNAVSIYLEQADGTLHATQSVAVGVDPTAIAVLDFNGDGWPDLAVLNSGDGSVSVLLRDPQDPEKFQAPVPVLVGSIPLGLVTGDFNADGLPDIAVANFGDNTISVLENEAANPGQFKLSATIATESGPSAIATGDFSQSGHLDLAVTNYFDGTLSIFAGTPDSKGLFAAPTRANLIGSGPTAVVATDLNGDGIVDLVVSDSLDGTVGVLTASSRFPGSYPEEYLIAGFNKPTSIAPMPVEGGTGLPDLAVGDSVAGSLTILHNDGFGRFNSRSVLEVGSTLTATSHIERFSSGSYQIAALDPSLEEVHFASAYWNMSGSFQKISDTSSSVRIVQATAIPALGGPGVISNTLTLAATALRSQVITFENPDPVTYGTSQIQLQATATSGLPVQFTVISGQAALAGSKISPTGAGFVQIRAEQVGDSEYAAASPVERSLQVGKAALTITPAAAMRLAGEPNPVFQGTVSGLVGSDALGISYTSAASQSTPPGVYDSLPLGITGQVQDSTVAMNYSVTSSVGVFTICPTPKQQVEGTQLTSSCGNMGQDEGKSGGSSGSNSADPLPPVTFPPSVPKPISSPWTGPVGQPGQGKPTAPVLAPNPIKTPILSPVHPEPVQGMPVVGGTGNSPVDGTGSGEPKTPRPLPPGSGGGLTPPVVVPVSGAPVIPPQQSPSPQPTKGPQSSGSPVIIPIPVTGPVFGLPSLPHLGVSLPSFGGRSAVKVSTGSTLLLLGDRRVPALYGWSAITLTLACPGANGTEQTVLMADKDVAIASIKVRAGQEYRTRIPFRDNNVLSLTAHFAGSRSCGGASSQSIVLVNPGSDLPLDVGAGLREQIESDPVQPYIGQTVNALEAGSESMETLPVIEPEE
jgi:hypothetical protein